MIYRRILMIFPVLIALGLYQNCSQSELQRQSSSAEPNRLSSCQEGFSEPLQITSGIEHCISTASVLNINMQEHSNKRMKVCAYNACGLKRADGLGFLESLGDMSSLTESCVPNRELPLAGSNIDWFVDPNDDRLMYAYIDINNQQAEYPDGFQLCFQNAVSRSSDQLEVVFQNEAQAPPVDPPPSPNPDPPPSPPPTASVCDNLPADSRKASSFRVERNNLDIGSMSTYQEWLGPFPMYDYANAIYRIDIRRDEYLSLPFTVPQNPSNPRARLQFTWEDNTNNSDGVSLSISECEGGILKSHALRPECYRAAGKTGADIKIGINPQNSLCLLEPGKTYYLNVMHLNEAGEKTCDRSSCTWLVAPKGTGSIPSP